MSTASSSESVLAVELEHAICFSGGVPGALQCIPASIPTITTVGNNQQPNNNNSTVSDRFVATAGACAVINSQTDPHSQVFLRGHHNNISCMTLSHSGRLLATGETGYDSDIIIWDIVTGNIVYRLQEHDHGIQALSFSHDDRLLISVGVDNDGTFFIWDLSTGGIVYKGKNEPVPLLCVAWGGFAKDIKGRDTGLYLFATGGGKGLSLWSLDPLTGVCAHEKIAAPVSTSLARDYISLSFSPGPDYTWLYAGSASGDIVIVHIKTQSIYHSTYCCGGGVTQIVVSPAIARNSNYSNTMNRYGGNVSSSVNTISGVDIFTAGGDGTLSMWHHATSTLDQDMILNAPVSSSATAGVSRPNLANRTFNLVRNIHLEGAIWALSLYATPYLAYLNNPNNPNNLSLSYALLVGTSAGCLYNLYTIDGPSKIIGNNNSNLNNNNTVASFNIANAGGTFATSTYQYNRSDNQGFSSNSSSSSNTTSANSKGLSATLFRQAHASPGDGFDPSTAVTLALAAKPGSTALPQPVSTASQIGSVDGISFAPNINDQFATVGSDNTVRIWDLTAYSCTSITHVRAAGHPQTIAYAGEFHMSGWQDGSLRVYYSNPSIMANLSDTNNNNTLSNGRNYNNASPLRTTNNRKIGNGGIIGTREDKGYLWSIPDAHSSASGGITCLGLSHNQRFCVTGGGDARVRVWDMRSREMVSAFVEHGGPINDIAIYKDDAHILSCSSDKSFMCWDLRREARISSHTQRSGGINAIAISRDQSLVITSGLEGKLQLWDLREPAPVLSIAPIHGNDGHALTLAPAHSKDIVVTGGTDGIVKFWDIRSTSSPLAECVGHSGNVKKVAWSPDDKQLVSVGQDGAILLWNVYG